MSNWQPIESAPKDGTQVLGFDEFSGVCECVQYLKDEWVTTWDHEDFGRISHWMPLPVPPTDA